MSLTRQQQAAVIYFAIPKDERTMGVGEFCKEVLTVSERTLRNWYDLPEFKGALKSARAEYNKRSGDLFEKAARAKAMMVMISGMKNPDKETQRKYATSVLREVKNVSEATDTISMQAFSDEQLIGQMFNLGLNLPAGELEKFRPLLGLEEMT